MPKDKTHLTAITRTRLSAPAAYLKKQNLLKGKCLDYGCGKGFDSRALRADKYDPYYYPDKPGFRQYNTILCIYVLNVIPNIKLRNNILKSIRKLLTRNGIAYIAVRNDTENLNGYTSKGTWQGIIILPYAVIHRTKQYILYKMTKG